MTESIEMKLRNAFNSKQGLDFEKVKSEDNNLTLAKNISNNSNTSNTSNPKLSEDKCMNNKIVENTEKLTSSKKNNHIKRKSQKNVNLNKKRKFQ